MPATYEPIASQTLGTAAASVSFSSISGTFTDLLLVCMVRGTTTGTFNFNTYVRIQVNGDTGTNYSATQIYSRSSAGSWSALSLRSTNETAYSLGPAPDSQHAADIFGPQRVHFMSYANTNVNKTVLAESGYSSNLTNHDGPRRDVGLWRNTAAITSMSISLTTGNLAVGCTFSLFGLKAA
jgi:hypothetical protein